MGKKQKKRKKKPAEGKQASPEQMERQARDALDGGRFRRARALYLKLFNLDPDRHLPGLVEATDGLCRVLMGQGKAAEAEKALRELEALDASAVPAALKIALGLRRGDYEQAALGAVQGLGDGRPASGMDDPAPADALVLRCDPPGGGPDLPPEIEADRAAVQAALEHICGERYGEALETLRPVGLRSPFAHWRWFAKGLCAFYRSEDEVALKAFSRLPSGSVPARAAEPYRLILGGPDALAGNAKDRDLLAEACRVAGRPDLADVLPRADYLWRAGRIRDAYVFLRKHLEGFPSDTPGVEKSLSALFFKGVFSLDERQAERFMAFVEESLANGNRPSSVEKALAARAAALYWEREVPESPRAFEEISRFWSLFLEARARVHGGNRRMEAAVHAHLGDYFSEERHLPRGPFSRFFNGSSSKHAVLFDQERAESSYRRSLALDPDNRGTHFALLRLYEVTGDQRRLNRTLDEIIKRFPDDKEALHRAGLRCLDRKAFVKGMKYLERALDLDPLDTSVRESFIKACLHVGARYLREGKRERFQGLLPRVLDRASPRSDNLVRGRPYVRAMWGIASMKAGLDREGRDLLDRAFDENGGTLRLHAYVHVIASCEGLKGDVFEPSRARFEQETAGSPAVEPARHLIDVLAHAFSLTLCGSKLKKQRRALEAYLARGLEQSPVSRDLARLVVGPAWDEDLVSLELRERTIRRMLDQDPWDPYFRLHRLMMGDEKRLHLPDQDDLEEAQEILRLAREARDEELVGMACSVVSSISEALDHLASLRALLSMEEDDLDDLDDLEVMDALEELLDEEAEPEEEPPGAPREGRSSEKKQGPKKDKEQLNLFD